MKITTVGEATIESVQLVALLPQAAADQVPKSFTDDSGKTETKVDPNGSGRLQHRTALKALRVVDGAPVSEERDTTIAILEPTDLQIGVMYGLSGVTTITHYNTNAGRMGVSIVAERVKPLDQINKVDVKDLADRVNRPAKSQG